MASTVTISVLRCSVCRKLEDTPDPEDTRHGGVVIPSLTRYTPLDGRAWEDLWICHGCTSGKSLGNLLEIISRLEDEDAAGAEEARERAFRAERQALEGWANGSPTGKGASHYYRAGASLCHKMKASQLGWAYERNSTEKRCPTCAQRLEEDARGKEATRRSTDPVARAEALEAARAEDAEKAAANPFRWTAPPLAQERELEATVVTEGFSLAEVQRARGLAALHSNGGPLA